MKAGQPLNVNYSYTSQVPLEIAIDLFDAETHTWVDSERIPLIPGIQTSSRLVDLSALPSGSYYLNQFLVPPGGDWTEAIEWGEVLNFTTYPTEG